MTSFGCVPFASVCPCARCVEAKTSPSSIARQTPDGDGLLADRDVQEARQLAGAEPLLDLLLEAPDEQHLAEEVPQALGRDGRPFSSTLPRRRQASVRVNNCVRDGRLPIASTSSSADSPATGSARGSTSPWTQDDDADRAALLLAPASPGRIGAARFTFTSRRGAVGNRRSAALADGACWRVSTR